MSNNLRRCLKRMRLYCNTDCKKLRKSMINDMSKKDEYFKALHEIIDNISANKIKIAPQHQKKLKKYIPLFKKIKKKPKSKSARAKLVKQSGGVFPLLIPAAATVAGALINKFL